MAEERVFLNVDGVYVSNTRVIILGTTYATANITSVRKNTVPPNTGCATILSVLAALWTAGALIALMFTNNANNVASNFAGLLIAIVFLVVGILWFRSLKPVYHVMIASASGERQGLTSSDESLVNHATAAIADAITFRG
jgi:hypothetical protein